VATFNLDQPRSAKSESRSLFIKINSGRIPKMPLAVCPECEAEIHVDEEIDKGETMHCEECDARLEVVGLDPIELDVVAEAEEEDLIEEDEY
jgi:alpha-aminoadipate/glutamate carrier protein LysW